MRLPGSEPQVDQPKTQSTEPTTKSAFSFEPIALVLLVAKRWPLILFSVIVFTALSLTYAYYAPNVHRAAARIEVFQENRLRGKKGLNEYDKLESQANRHIIIMSGNMFHLDLISKLRPKWKDLLTLEEMKVPVQIQGVGRSTSMIDLYVDSTDKEYALDYLNGILGSYSELRRREFVQINENAVAGLRYEEERIQGKLNEVKQKIEQFEFENKILIARERQAMQNELINNLLDRLQALQIERSILEYQYEEIVNADLRTIRTTLDMNPDTYIREFLLDYENETSAPPQQPLLPIDPYDSESALIHTALGWEQQEDLLASLNNDYIERLITFQTSHPKMRKLESQMNAIKASLEKKLEISVRRFQARYQALKREEEAIEKVIKNMENKTNLVAKKNNEYQLLKSQEAQLKNKYDLVYQQILENAGSIDSLQVITIQEPYIWREPIAPNKTKLLMIGPFLGLFFSIGFILFKGFLLPALSTMFRQYQQNQQSPTNATAALNH